VINAQNSAEGQAMLKGIGFPRFETATADVYNNQSRVLKAYWGY